MTQATPFDTILTQCRDLFCDRLASALASMLDKADGAISALLNETRDPLVQKLYRDVRDKALAKRETIETQFRTRYLREFQERSNRAKKIGDNLADIDLSSMELELVAEDDLNETLKFNAMAAKLRQYCDEELIALDQRVGVLFGDADLLAEDNPFMPQAICSAYKQTCSQVDSNVEARMVLLKLFDDHVLDDIRGIYKAVNALLVQNSILPKIRVGGARKERSKAAPPSAKPGATSPEAPPHADDKAATGEPDLFALLQNLITSSTPGASQTGPAANAAPGHTAFAAPGYPPMAGFSAPARGTDAASHLLQGAELLRSLTRVQLGDVSAVTGNTQPLAAVAGEPGTNNVLRELKGSSLGSGMNRMDAMTLDIVALLFDQLFDDPKIPIGVKGLIGRLQIPILKVAIADKAFFSKKTHPARHMLDTLGEISSRLPPDVNASNAAYGRLDTILQQLIEGFEDNIEIFDVVRERLETLIPELDQRIEQETQSAEKQIEQEETLALAKTVAQAQIKVRLRATDLPDAIVDFLIKQWLKVLLLVHVKLGEETEDWKNAIETMDLLIWSVEPKNTREERRELVTKVPQLLKQVTDALKFAGVEDATRLGFFADLRKLHSGVLATADTFKPLAPSEASPAVDPTDTVEAPALEAIQPSQDLPPESPSIVDLPPLEFAASISAAPSNSPPAPSPVLEENPSIPATPIESPPRLDLPPLEFSLPIAATPEHAAPAVEQAPQGLKLPTSLSDAAPDIKPLSTKVDTPIVTPPSKATPRVEPPSAPKPAIRDSLPEVQSPTKPAAPSTGTPTPSAPLKSSPPAKPVAATPEPLPRVQPAAKPPAASIGARQNPAQRAAAPPSPKEASPRVQAQAAPKQAVRPPPAAAQKTQATATGKASVVSADFTAPVTVSNPFGSGEVQVNDLDFTVQLRESGTPAKTENVVPGNLTMGSWVAIHKKSEKDARQLAKLAFISPLKTRYLFVDRHGKKVLECSQAELLRMLDLGELAVTNEVPETPLFDRITEGMVGKLGGRK